MAHPNPKDSMKSTWLHGDRSQWTFSHRMLGRRLLQHPEYDVDIPTHAKSDAIPYMPQWSQHRFILTRSLAPVLAHQCLLWLTGWASAPLWSVLPFYVYATMSMMGRLNVTLRKLGHEHGFLDGDEHARDGVPDAGVGKVAAMLFKMLAGRPALTALLAFKASQTPIATLGRPEWWGLLAVHLGLYAIILDFYFYWYHRAMHDITPLWKYHRTHHLTKHPNPMLAGYADEEQEIGDIFVIPLLTFFTMRLVFGADGFDFFHWWVCQANIMYTEAVGHSGLRVFMMPPSTVSYVLKYFNLALAIEDHDLHHRKGHRKSFNYGKQTRIWDTLFGTTFERYEAENVDYNNTVTMPIF